MCLCVTNPHHCSLVTLQQHQHTVPEATEGLLYVLLGSTNRRGREDPTLTGGVGPPKSQPIRIHMCVCQTSSPSPPGLGMGCHPVAGVKGHHAVQSDPPLGGHVPAQRSENQTGVLGPAAEETEAVQPQVFNHQGQHAMEGWQKRTPSTEKIKHGPKQGLPYRIHGWDHVVRWSHRSRAPVRCPVDWPGGTSDVGER